MLRMIATQTGAFSRARKIKSPGQLLRLLLIWSFCDFSLQKTASWYRTAAFVSISKSALYQRFQKSHDFLALLLTQLLVRRDRTTLKQYPHRVRLIDASTLSRPGAEGIDWRLHLSFELTNMLIDGLELTDVRGGETLCRWDFEPGELVIVDAGYGHRRGLAKVATSGAFFISRFSWSNLPLETIDGEAFDLLGTLRSLGKRGILDRTVRLQADTKNGLPALPVRLIAKRKPWAAAQKAKKRILKEARQKKRAVRPETLAAAEYIFVVTNAPRTTLEAAEVLEFYRFRWQVELVFKRLKSLLKLKKIPVVENEVLAQTFLYAKLIGALLIENLSSGYGGFDFNKERSLWKSTDLIAEVVRAALLEGLRLTDLLSGEHAQELTRDMRSDARWWANQAGEAARQAREYALSN